MDKCAELLERSHDDFYGALCDLRERLCQRGRNEASPVREIRLMCYAGGIGAAIEAFALFRQNGSFDVGEIMDDLIAPAPVPAPDDDVNGGMTVDEIVEARG